MAVETYDKGDVLEIQAAYVQADGSAIDPSVVKFSVKNPAGDITTYTYPVDSQLVRSGTGVYTVNLHFSLAGRWLVRHYATGTGEGSAEKEYYVKPSAFS